MNGLKFLLFLLIVTAPAHAERRRAGIFFGWGVFTENRPKNCFAATRPAVRSGDGSASPHASISFGPGRPGELYVRLRAVPRAGSSVLLRIDGRSFPLAARGHDAWLADARATQIVVALMRTGTTMTVETRAKSGARIRDIYALKGAASAIDAAAVACARR